MLGDHILNSAPQLGEMYMCDIEPLCHAWSSQLWAVFPEWIIG